MAQPGFARIVCAANDGSIDRNIARHATATGEPLAVVSSEQEVSHVITTTLALKDDQPGTI